MGRLRQAWELELELGRDGDGGEEAAAGKGSEEGGGGGGGGVQMGGVGRKADLISGN